MKRKIITIIGALLFCNLSFAGIGASGTTPGCIVGTLGLHFIFGVKFPSW